MAKETPEETIARLSREYNELNDLKLAAERGQNAMLTEAKRLADELTDLRQNYVQVPKELWEIIDRMPGQLNRAKQAHPFLLSNNDNLDLFNATERWGEVIK